MASLFGVVIPAYSTEEDKAYTTRHGNGDHDGHGLRTKIWHFWDSLSNNLKASVSIFTIGDSSYIHIIKEAWRVG